MRFKGWLKGISGFKDAEKCVNIAFYTNGVEGLAEAARSWDPLVEGATVLKFSLDGENS